MQCTLNRTLRLFENKLAGIDETFYRLKIPFKSLVLTWVNKGIRMLNGLPPRRGPEAGEVTTSGASLAVDMASATLPDSPSSVPWASLRLWASSPPPYTPALAIPSAQKSFLPSRGINAFMTPIRRDGRSGKGKQNVVEWAEHSLGSHWQI